MSRVRIIGIGSAMGDDRVGWDAIDALSEISLPAGTELHRIGAPAAELLPLLSGVDRVILVDAIASGDAPGRLVQCDPRALRRADGDVSGHGLSLDTVLDLAAALGELPAEVLLIGVAIDPGAGQPGTCMTRPVARALPALIAAITGAAYAEGVPS